MQGEAIALYAHLSHPAHARALLPTLALIHAAHGPGLRPTFTRRAPPAPPGPAAQGNPADPCPGESCAQCKAGTGHHDTIVR